MTELNGNDDCRYVVSLPTAAQYSAKIEAGDLMLYGSSLPRRIRPPDITLPIINIC